MYRIFCHQLHHLFKGLNRTPLLDQQVNQPVQGPGYTTPGLKAGIPGAGGKGGKVGSKLYPMSWLKIPGYLEFGSMLVVDDFFHINVCFLVRFTMIYYKSFKSPSVFWKVLVPELLFFGL